MSELSKQHRLGEIKEHPFGSDRGFRASHFLAGIHEQAIERVVSSAAEGMAFLQACAAALAREGKHFSFITKWGFPVHQQYVKFKPNRAKVWWFDEVSNKIDRQGRATLRNLTDEINITKSCNAVAPNVIHAQDSLHLMMSVQTCASHGVTDLMVVHDSFSTTIADASTMSWAIRKPSCSFTTITVCSATSKSRCWQCWTNLSWLTCQTFHTKAAWTSRLCCRATTPSANPIHSWS